MKLPKSSENMLRAFSMGGSWAGRARAAEEAEEEEAEEEEEEWKLLSALKLEEVRWLIHSGQPGPARGRVDAGAGEGAGGVCRARPPALYKARPSRARGQPLVYRLNLGLAGPEGLESFSCETRLLTGRRTQAREAELIAWHSRPITPAPAGRSGRGGRQAGPMALRPAPGACVRGEWGWGPGLCLPPQPGLLRTLPPRVPLVARLFYFPSPLPRSSSRSKRGSEW